LGILPLSDSSLSPSAKLCLRRLPKKEKGEKLRRNEEAIHRHTNYFLLSRHLIGVQFPSPALLPKPQLFGDSSANLFAFFKQLGIVHCADILKAAFY